MGGNVETRSNAIAFDLVLLGGGKTRGKRRSLRKSSPADNRLRRRSGVKS